MDVVHVAISIAIAYTIMMIVVLWPKKRACKHYSAHPRAQLYIEQSGRNVRIFEQRTDGCIGAIKLPFRYQDVGISRLGLFMHATDKNNSVRFYNLEECQEVHSVPSLNNVAFVMYNEDDTAAVIHVGKNHTIEVSTIDWKEILCSTPMKLKAAA